MTEVHKFHAYPSKAELFRVWNAAKSLGEVRKRHSFARHGCLEQVWGGWVLAYYP